MRFKCVNRNASDVTWNEGRFFRQWKRSYKGKQSGMHAWKKEDFFGNETDGTKANNKVCTLGHAHIYTHIRKDQQLNGTKREDEVKRDKKRRRSQERQQICIIGAIVALYRPTINVTLQRKTETKHLKPSIIEVWLFRWFLHEQVFDSKIQSVL